MIHRRTLFSCSYTSEGVFKSFEKNCSVALQEGNEVAPAAALGILLLSAWRISHPDEVLIDRLNPGMKAGNVALHKEARFSLFPAFRLTKGKIEEMPAETS